MYSGSAATADTGSRRRFGWVGSPSIPAKRLFVQIDVNLFHLEIFVEAPASELAAKAALLVSTPRRFHRAGLRGIDPHHSRPQPFDEPHDAEDVARPHRRREAVVGVVRDLQGLFF